jgi:glyoxylase-like metal-dependent hydrolase (beta-lactamase superfamily II)
VARVPAIELVPGVVRIPTVGAANINSYAVVDDAGGVTLVDCGLRRAPATIVAGLRAAGIHPGDVRRIVLTHAHTDHARVGFAHGPEITDRAREAVRTAVDTGYRNA